MAKCTQFYRCENEYGADPCIYAIENRKISSAETTPNMGNGNPKCPGKTKGGNTCGHVLIPIPSPKPRRMPWMLIAAGIIGVGVLATIAWLLISGEKPARLEVDKSSLVFPHSSGGVSTSALTIRNPGEGVLRIDRFEVSPADFSVTETTLQVEPGGQASIIVRHQPATNGADQGSLVIHSNAENVASPVTLRVNPDPWWVYDSLDASSSLLN